MKLFKVLETSFDNFDNTVRTYLQKTFGNLGVRYTHNQIFGVIFDGIKGVMQNAMFYIEDALTEQNIFTATRKKSVYNLAKISGYEPYYGSAATGTIIANTFVTNTAGSVSTKIYIKDGQKLTNKTTGVTYTIMMPQDSYIFDIAKPLVKHEFKIVQGEIAQATFIGINKEFSSYDVSTNGLYDKQYTSVTVNGVEYSQAASIYDMTEDSLEYVISTGFDSAFKVTFGNGIYGKQINEGDTIIVKYIQHSGTSGNISTASNANFEFVDKCTNGFGNEIDGNDYINLEINAPISGGTDSDTISMVRNLVGYNSRSLVLASEDNFKLFLKRFGFIGRTNIFSESNSLTITASCLANVDDKLQSSEDYLDINENDLLLSESQKNMVVTTLNNTNKIFAGVTFTFEDPVIRKYAGLCYVKIKDSYNKDSIKTSIRNSIADYFMNLESNTLFIPKSDIIKKVLEDNKDTISSFDIQFISDLNESAFNTGYYYGYKQQLINGVYKYVPYKIIYESDSTPGIDDYGNIQLTSNLEVPLLHGGFKYYPNKQENDKTTSMNIDTLQIMFI
jgi:hypothetical protein